MRYVKRFVNDLSVPGRVSRWWVGGCMLTRVGLFYGLFTPDVPLSILVVSIFFNTDDHDDWKGECQNPYNHNPYCVEILIGFVEILIGLLEILIGQFRDFDCRDYDCRDFDCRDFDIDPIQVQ